MADGLLFQAVYQADHFVPPTGATRTRCFGTAPALPLKSGLGGLSSRALLFTAAFSALFFLQLVALDFAVVMVEKLAS